MENKTIYLLLGQKGSGKTFIGYLFEKHFQIKFIRVEDWAKQIKKDRQIDNESYLAEVFSAIEKGIRTTLTECDQLVFESTGLTIYFDQMLSNLKRDYKVVTIQILADPNLCLNRVKTRNQSIHINVSDDQVNAINTQVLQKQFETDFIIDNNQQTEGAIKTMIAEILEAIN
ncbi:MAG: hypothetical protein CMO01_20090 [Thalassobius sp.]|nr:hypothetical protein [Thalassovita sp.]